MNRMTILLAVLILSCEPKRGDNPIAPLSEVHNSVSMQIGDSWLFKRLFVNIIDSGYLDIPDTLTGYSYFLAEKDTVIENKSFIIIDGRDYEVNKDSIVTFHKRCAIHFGDTVSMYEFRSSDWGFHSGIMKRQANVNSISMANFGTSALKQMHLQKVLSKSNYDSTMYKDLVYPMVFPLLKDSLYVYRDSADPCGNLPCRRRYLGIEDIFIALGQFQAYKFEYLCIQENLMIWDVHLYDWIGSNGLLKRFLDAGIIDITDSIGNTTGRFRSYEAYELIGKNDIDADTLIPWGREQ